MKCIIVDNNRRTADICKRTVSGVYGFEAKIFTTLSKVIEYLENGNDVGLIILDIAVNDIDPKKFIANIKTLDSDNKIDIMICSEINDSDSILSYIGLGIVGYIVKPYSVKAFQGQLQVIRSRLSPENIPANKMWKLKPS